MHRRVRATLRRLVAVAVMPTALLLSAQRSDPFDTEMVVFCDVSTSLSPAVIQSEAGVIFQFINSPTLFPAGKFSIHIANRDVEQEPFIEGKKVITRYPEDAVRQLDKLTAQQNGVEQELLSYIQHESRRSHTCLVKALHSLPALFQDNTKPESRRIVIVSDMLEDCFGSGDPKTAGELRLHIQESIKRYPLPNLKGARLYAIVVSSGASPMDLETLRKVWGEELRAADISFSLGSINELTHRGK